MNKTDRKKQIENTLLSIDLYSVNAVNLLLETMAQESAFGKYRRQIGGGPAMGIMQIEPATHADTWENFLKYRKELGDKILQASGLEKPDVLALENNDVYSICIARVKYFRDPYPIPGTVDERAKFWKRVYNTEKGKGTVVEYIKNYYKFVK